MPEDLYDAVAELTTAGLLRDEQLAHVLQLAGGDRAALERARDRYAMHLHSRPDDFTATAALTLLNRALAECPLVEPLDWKQRWARGRKP